MSEPASRPVPYRVSYSQRVRAEFQRVADLAKASGSGLQILNALKRLDLILHIFPQYGEPLRDLTGTPGTIWIMTVSPFVIHYYPTFRDSLQGILSNYLRTVSTNADPRSINALPTP